MASKEYWFSWMNSPFSTECCICFHCQWHLVSELPCYPVSKKLPEIQRYPLNFKRDLPWIPVVSEGWQHQISWGKIEFECRGGCNNQICLCLFLHTLYRSFVQNLCNL
jgi:hypothetical protein